MHLCWALICLPLLRHQVSFSVAGLIDDLTTQPYLLSKEWKPQMQAILANQTFLVTQLQNVQQRQSQHESEMAGRLSGVQRELQSVRDKVEEVEWGGGVGAVEGAVEALRTDLNALRQAWEARHTSEINQSGVKCSELENKVNQIALVLRRLSNQVAELGRTTASHLRVVARNTSALAELMKTNSKEEKCTQPPVHVSTTVPLLINVTRNLPLDCWEVLRQGRNRSGVYQIQPSLYSQPFMAVCDMTSMGGGWTVFQSRVDGSTHFTRQWKEYETGFGNTAAKEFWLGLDQLHQITNARVNDLLVTLEDQSGDSAWAYYEQFAIGNANQEYAITSLGNYHGTAGDSMRGHTYKFSSEDRDNDLNEGISCARSGAWWYQDCEDQDAAFSNLNGLYLNGSLPQVFPAQGMLWTTWRGLAYSISRSAMMVRPSADVYRQPVPTDQGQVGSSVN